MSIVSVNIKGGLGNQLFQIAAAYAYAAKEKGVLQILYKENNGNRPVYWNTILQKIHPYLVTSLPQGLEVWSEIYPTMYSEIGPLSNSGKYLIEYMQTSKYFYTDEIKKQIKRLFTPNEILMNDIRTKYNYLMNRLDRIIVLHARRTDYVTFKEVHGPLEASYYANAINIMMSLYTLSEPPIFLMCSDDQEYWNQISEEISIVGQHEHYILATESDIVTFALLQQCNKFIMSNSTFIWWCVWMSNAKNVIAPAKWFGPAGPTLYEDIYEPTWMRL